MDSPLSTPELQEPPAGEFHAARWLGSVGLERRVESGESPGAERSGRSLLDLFCCEGGAGEGYRRAGFDVTGVDIEPRPRNPHRFVLGDALEYLRDHGREYDVIHASPPCQGYTTMNNRRGKENTPRLIGEVRELLEASGKPWVIENVLGARSEMRNPILLTGEMFGLRVYRPRLFECSEFLLSPPQHQRQENPVAVYGKQDGRRIWTRKDGTELRAAKLPEASVAMGINWMSWDGIREAIPPAYTEWLGSQLLRVRWAAGAGRGAEMRVNGTAEELPNGAGSAATGAEGPRRPSAAAGSATAGDSREKSDERV